MGLFRRKKTDDAAGQSSAQVEHPLVERTIYLRADETALTSQLEGYASIMGARARELPLVVDRAGEWLRLALPIEGVHPWECTNLAFWLHEVGDVVVVSAASPTFPTHWLVRAADPGDLLEGWTEDGEAITVHVPSNVVVRDDGDVGVARCGVVEALTGLGIPLTGWESVGVVTARSEDPGRELEPGLGRSVRDRRALQPFGLS